ncbi:MAG: hypothetical protein OXH31_09695 [Gammaproteobacteria bacterium]|nr:hypothetical protein [Gammaproteobacteria bacterium]
MFLNAVSACDRGVSSSRTRDLGIGAVAWSTATRTDPGDGQWLVLSGTAISGRFAASISTCAHPVPDPATAGITRALSWDLKKGRSVLSYL